MSWYKKYPKLSSVLFTYDNSGNKAALPPPYRTIMDEDLNTKYIEGQHGINKIWNEKS